MAIFLVPSCCKSQSIQNWDKAAHFVAGGHFASSVQFCIEKNHNNQFFIGFGCSYLIGIGKEFYDSKFGGTVSDTDLLRTWQGGFFGSISCKMAYNRHLFKYSNKKHYSTFWE